MRSLHPRSRSESGLVLLIAIIGVLVTLGITAALITVGTADARSLTESTERSRALYVAEAGLEGARYEMGEETDPQGDGEGNRTGSSSAGAYAVTAVDLGSNLWRLTSTGTSGSSTVQLEEVVELTYSSRFPGGALSMVGGMATTQILFAAPPDPTSDVLIDGGATPGIALSDANLYTTVGNQIVANGVSPGYIDAADVTGSVSNTFQPGNVDLSIQHVPSTSSSVAITGSMYTDFRNQIQNVFLPAATSKTFGASSATWGTAGSPVQYKFPVDSKIVGGQTISGHGNLVMSRNMIIEAGGTLNWTGNVIVFGDAGNDSNFDIDGTMNVTGNVVTVSAPGRLQRFLVKSTGNVTVNGALTGVTDFTNAATKIDFLIENNLTVNGLITLVAPKHQTEFKPGSDVNITGSLQMGRMAGAQAGTELKIKFEDAFEIHRDEASVSTGANALVSLGGAIGSSVLSTYMTRISVETRSWRVVPEA